MKNAPFLENIFDNLAKLGYRSSTTALEGADCQVCGAKAGRHSYYGAYTCKSCRAFFRRSVAMNVQVYGLTWERI